MKVLAAIVALSVFGCGGKPAASAVPPEALVRQACGTFAVSVPPGFHTESSEVGPQLSWDDPRAIVILRGGRPDVPSDDEPIAYDASSGSGESTTAPPPPKADPEAEAKALEKLFVRNLRTKLGCEPTSELHGATTWYTCDVPKKGAHIHYMVAFDPKSMESCVAGCVSTDADPASSKLCQRVTPTP